MGSLGLDYMGDKTKVPDGRFLFAEAPPLKKLALKERFHILLHGEIPFEVLPTPDSINDPSDLRSVLGSSSGWHAETEMVVAVAGAVPGPLDEDLALQALRAPRRFHNPEIVQGFKKIEKGTHELVLKLPAKVKLDAKQKKFYTKLVTDLINNRARTVIYDTHR